MSAGKIRIELLVDSMTQLTTLYGKEAGLIAARDSEGLRELTETKIRLARAYEESLRTLARDPDGLTALEPEEMAHLQEVAMAFQAASLANAAAVRVAIGATDALAATMVQAINIARELDDTGMTTRPTYGRGRVPPPTTYNQVL